MPYTAKYGLSLLWTFGILIFLAGIAYAKNCPPNSESVSSTETSGGTLVTCRCHDGFWAVKKACVARDSADLQVAAAKEYQLLVDSIQGKALDNKEAIQNYVLAQKWPPQIATAMLLSTLDMAWGRFERASDMLGVVTGFVEDDVINVYAQLVDDRRRSFVIRDRICGLMYECVDPDLISHFKVAAQRKIIQASIRQGQGDYDTAIELYQEALGDLERSLEFRARSEINDTIVWTSQLKAARDERIHPGARAELYRQARETAAAQGAWRLAQALADAEQKNLSLTMYKEARNLFSTIDNDDKWLLPTLEKQMKSVAEDRYNRDIPVQKNWYRYRTGKSEIVLDALEYAKGDWQRSLQYVDLYLKADPGNANLREARAYLEGLSAER